VLKMLAAVAALLAVTPAAAQALTSQPPQPSTAAQSLATQPAAATEAQKELAENYTMNLARRMLRGEEPPPDLPMGVVTAAAILHAQLLARLDSLLSSNLTGKDLVDGVRAIDNSTADTLQNVIDAKMAVPNDSRFYGYWDTIENLAIKAKPNWSEGLFKLVQEFKDPNGRIQHQLTSSQRMAEDAAQILDALKAVPSNTNIPRDAWKVFVDGRIADPTYTTLFEAWRLYAMEYARVDGLTVGNINSYLKSAYPYPILSTPQGFRSTLRFEAVIADTRIKGLRGYWRELGLEREAPGYSPEAEAIFRAIQRIDIGTGQILGDVPPRLRACCAYPLPVKEKAAELDRAANALLGGERLRPGQPTDAQRLHWAKTHMDDPRSVQIFQILRAKAVIE
jgi:hypothetical protein